MPMRLRNGSFYAPLESQHMILRDGKSVQAEQSLVFDHFYGCSTTNYVTLPLKYHRSPLLFDISDIDCYNNEVSVIEDNVVSEWNRPMIQNRRKFSESSTSRRPLKHGYRSNSYELQKKQQSVNSSKSMLLTRIKKSVVLLLAILVLIASKYVMLPAVVTTMFKMMTRFVSIIYEAFIFCTNIVCSLFSGLKTIFCLLYVGAHLLVGFVQKTIHLIKVKSFGIITKILHCDLTRRMKSTPVFAKPAPGFEVRKVRPETDLSGRYGITDYFSMSCLVALIGCCAIAAHLFIHILGSNMDWESIDDIQNKDKILITNDDLDQVLAWYISPESKATSQIASSLNDGAPLVFHLPADDKSHIEDQHRGSVLKALADLGFHVIAPILPITEVQFAKGWMYIKDKLKKNQSMFIWTDHVTTDVIRDYVTGIERKHLSPSGVVIESKLKDITNLVRSMEIWCDQKFTAQHWNYLKCPLNMDLPFSDQISSCIRAVEINSDFKVR